MLDRVTDSGLAINQYNVYWATNIITQITGQYVILCSSLYKLMLVTSSEYYWIITTQRL